MDPLRVESFGICHLKKRQQYVATCLRGTGWTCNTESITATGNIDIESAFYLSQVFVKLAA